MQDAGAARNQRTRNGPSRTPVPTGCVYLGAPVFGKPPIWAQQSHCTITGRRVSARCVGAAAIRGVHAIRCTAISIYFGFRGVRGGVYDAVSRAGGLETCGFKQTFWSLLGLRPKVTRARGAELSPLGTWWKHERAVGDAGPYAVRHCRAVRGSGSGDRGTSDSMRNPFVPWLESDKGNPKTVGFWRRSFPYFFRC